MDLAPLLVCVRDPKFLVCTSALRDMKLFDSAVSGHFLLLADVNVADDVIVVLERQTQGTQDAVSGERVRSCPVSGHSPPSGPFHRTACRSSLVAVPGAPHRRSLLEAPKRICTNGSDQGFFYVLARRTSEFWLLFPDSVNHFVRIRVLLAEVYQTYEVAPQNLYSNNVTRKSQNFCQK